MDLLVAINNCTEDELNLIIDNALTEIIKNTENGKRLGFQDGGLATDKIPAYKGFISFDSRIRYSNGSMYSYSMKSTDYFYEFAKFIKKNNVKTTNHLVKIVENFINYYFGKPIGKDLRDIYFDKFVLQTKTDEEMFDRIEKFCIGDMKYKNIAMCTERSAIAQNLLSLFGIEIYYCMGCMKHDGKEESHCFNIARARDKYILLDYSMPVAVVKDNKIYDYAPFKAYIELDEIEDVLLNSYNKNYEDYEYVNFDGQLKKFSNGDHRIYQVGKMLFQNSIKR